MRPVTGENADRDIVAAFARAMTVLGPFEHRPHLAVAVSGGADSLALCLLADGWATRRGGRVTAFTVDHRLRPESAEEAAQVGRWLSSLGICHRILVWNEAKPATGIQAAARRARYRLLGDACGEMGVLHLLVAHHAGDQAETMLMRAIDGSGADGLAGMQSVVTMSHGRILRPLLAFDPRALRRYLTALDHPWIEDPSNRSAAFARVRARRALPSLASAGLDAAALARIRTAMQDGRDATECAVVSWLATAVTVHDAGYAETDLTCLRTAPRFIAVHALARLAAAIGGSRWEPEAAAVDRVVSRLLGGCDAGSATLGRCRFLVRGDSILVCRERRNLPPPQPLTGSGDIHWDGRFRITVELTGEGTPATLRLQAVGLQSLVRLAVEERRPANPAAVPKLVWPTLPALADDRGLAQIPHLDYMRECFSSCARVTRVAFLSRRSLGDRDTFIV